MTQTPHLAAIMDDAVAWAVRVGDPAFDDWDGFEAWLGADPAHADAYHEASAAMLDASDLFAAMPQTRAAPAVATEPAAVRGRAWRRWAMPAGAAIAASIAGIIGIQTLRPHSPIVYETAPGRQQAITLADGSQVLLNGASRLEASRDEPRELTLVRGEAMFTVRHDDAHPFRVAVGGANVTDVGTRFDIVRVGSVTRLAVAEGAVDWQQQGAPVRLVAGQSLRATDGASTLSRASVAPDQVGDWSQGQLSFDGAALGEAAADLARALGTDVAIAPTIAERPVRGTIRLDGGAAASVPRFAALIGVRARRDGSGWRLDGSP